MSTAVAASGTSPTPPSDAAGGKWTATVSRRTTSQASELSVSTSEPSCTTHQAGPIRPSRPSVILPARFASVKGKARYHRNPVRFRFDRDQLISFSRWSGRTGGSATSTHRLMRRTRGLDRLLKYSTSPIP